MKTFEKEAAQGDVLAFRFEGEVPEGYEKQTPKNGQHIIAHSESGHHHLFDAKNVDFYTSANDSIRMFVVVKNEAPLIHNKTGLDSHEALNFRQGTYEIRRQRERSPEGWRLAAD